MLILVRHGQSARNRAGELSGRGDVPLDETGRRQANATGGALAHLDVGRVITSPLRRATETAERLDLPGAELVVDERWIELDYGDWEGREIRAVPADDWDRWRADIHFAPPNGESLAALGDRVREACAELAEEARTTHLVVVSHVSPVKAAMAWALGVGDQVSWRSHLSPASISRIAIGDRGPSLVGWNDLSHLP